MRKNYNGEAHRQCHSSKISSKASKKPKRRDVVLEKDKEQKALETVAMRKKEQEDTCKMHQENEEHITKMCNNH